MGLELILIRSIWLGEPSSRERNMVVRGPSTARGAPLDGFGVPSGLIEGRFRVVRLV